MLNSFSFLNSAVVAEVNSHAIHMICFTLGERKHQRRCMLRYNHKQATSLTTVILKKKINLHRFILPLSTIEGLYFPFDPQ